MPTKVTFAVLQERLLSQVQRRLQNGDFTERGFARIVGASQPHVHNVLKGARALTPGMADLILAGLDLSLLDLIDPQELGEALGDLDPRLESSRFVPQLAGRLGPADCFPDLREVENWVRLPAQELALVCRPALVRLGPDHALKWSIQEAGCVLLDLDEKCRTTPTESDWYVLRWRGAGYIRRIRRQGSKLLVAGQMSFVDSPDSGLQEPSSLDLTELSLLQIVRGKLIWLGKDPRPAGSLAGGVYRARPAASP